MRGLAFIAALAAWPAVASPPANPPSLAETINICRMAFFIDPAKGKMLFDAVPEEHKPAVALLCLSYKQGAQDMLDVVRRPKPRPVS